MSFPVRLLSAMICLASVACGASEKPADAKKETNPPAKTERMAALYATGWASFVARQPVAMKNLLDTSPQRGAWVKFYARDYQEAQRLFLGADNEGARAGLARAHLADAEMYAASYSLALDIEERFEAQWTSNASRLARTPLFDYVAGINAYRRGSYEVGLSHLEKFLSSPWASESGLDGVATAYLGAIDWARGKQADAEKRWRSKVVRISPAARYLVRTLGEAKTDSPLEEQEGLSLLEQKYLAYAAVQEGNIDLAEKVVGKVDFTAPDVEEDVAGEQGPIRRKYYDPLVLDVLAQLHGLKAMQALDGLTGAAVYRARAEVVLGRKVDGAEAVPGAVDERNLGLFLFSEYPTPADMARHYALLTSSPVPAEGIDLAALLEAEAGTPIGPEGDEGRQRELIVLASQAYIDVGRQMIGSSGDKEGASSAEQLKLVEGDISQSIRRVARRFIELKRLADGLFLLEHTLEKDATGFTFANDPKLFVDLTQVYCASLRYREALTYYYKLVALRPELLCVQEKLGDLSVLDTLDYSGRTAQHN